MHSYANSIRRLLILYSIIFLQKFRKIKECFETFKLVFVSGKFRQIKEFFETQASSFPSAFVKSNKRIKHSNSCNFAAKDCENIHKCDVICRKIGVGVLY